MPTEAARLDVVLAGSLDPSFSGTFNNADKTIQNFNDHITKSSYTTRFAVQNLANVFRDLPFAVNNPAIATSALDHVFSSLQALKSETGSLKGAFGALASSLGQKAANPLAT